MMVSAIASTYEAYSEARRRLIELSPCPKCCPPKHPCVPGERVHYGEIRLCKKCGGDGFHIDWEDD
jgi:hypothetical protein